MYDREALLAAVDLADLADDLLGAHVGPLRSPKWHCPNPQHAQTGRTPPLSIFHSHHGEQRWRCHGCGDGGTAIDLVVACKGGNVRDALDFLAGRVGHPDCGGDWSPPARPAVKRSPVDLSLIHICGETSRSTPRSPTSASPSLRRRSSDSSPVVGLCGSSAVAPPWSTTSSARASWRSATPMPG